ncbi:SARP family transcriptional regulator [Actinorhabdospora filicis]|uniref:SARP family transcriptional regulator n=1 Tax=Actinorhabdospora filicis TaxID=1785913 RepID=A0A9W6SLI3_9ACTN|nr:BTAD domain-containing putative transcriptional regulator [Actinorhabdospora filicis]GLZ77986.1 SARP family transcriptional regulator [Actinorhabdospora filicis]
MEFRLFGELRVSDGGAPVYIGAAHKQRLTLALLLHLPGRTVDVDRLAEALWPDGLPSAPRRNVKEYAHRLRRVLGAGRIAHGPGGYRFTLQPGDTVDVESFRGLAATGDAGNIEDALALWDGAPYREFAGCEPLDADARHLTELRLDAHARWARARLEQARPDEVAKVLGPVAAEEPYREDLHALLMLALHASGRRAEALDAYRTVHAALTGDLGVEPGRRLQQAHRDVLRGEADAPSALWHLPAPLADFTGRTRELAEAENHLLDALGTGRAAIVALSGLPGVGKSATALVLAHRVAARAPAGQLHIDLHGHADPRDPLHALRYFLRRLAMEGAGIPHDLDEAAALYRELLSAAPRTIVLDNAAGAGQLAPLLPPPGCPVIVTSRRLLADLDGALRLALDPLPSEDAVALLRAVLGPARIEAEAAAAAEIIGFCDRLPLALRIAAGHGLHRRPLHEIAAALREAEDRLGHLVGDERSVGAALASGYATLGRSERALLAGLAATTWGEFPAWPAGVVLGVSPRAGARVLGSLVASSFVEPAGADELGQPRFRLHDLVRAFARPLAGPGVLDRVGEAWLALCTEADAAIESNAYTARRASGVTVPAGLSVHRESPQRWFAVESQEILGLLREAAASGRDERCWRLAWTFETFLRFNADLTELSEVAALGHAAAERSGVPEGIAQLGLIRLFESSMRDNTIAGLEDLGERALSAARAHGDPWLLAELLSVLAEAHRDRGERAEAEDHLREAHALFVAAGDATSAGSKLTMLGELAAARGADDEADVYFERGVAHLREGGAPRRLAMGLRRFGVRLRDNGHRERARAALTECLDLVGGIDEPVGELAVRVDLAVTLVQLGRAGEAAEVIAPAHELAERVTIPHFRHWLTFGDALVAGDADRAAAAVAGLRSVPPLAAVALTEIALLRGGEPGAVAAAREAIERAALPGLAARLG